MQVGRYSALAHEYSHWSTTAAGRRVLAEQLNQVQTCVAFAMRYLSQFLNPIPDIFGPPMGTCSLDGMP